METTDKATAIREARQQLRARGEPDSMNRVVAIVRSSKRTVQKYWAVTDPGDAGSPGPAPTPVPASVPAAPEPEPAFTLENLRLLYTDRLHSPWPAGICPPLSTYPLLCELWREGDRVIAAADLDHRRLTNAMGQQPRGAVDAGPLRQVEARRGAAVVMCNAIETDRRLLRDRAYREGITLPE